MDNETRLEESLHTYFGYENFRAGQKDIIQAVLAGRSVLGILPTGSGKSVCYQLPAQMMDGTTIVISPLISLMIDQVKQLKANHIKDVIAINSFMDHFQKREAYAQLHTYKIIYVSPELIQQEELLVYLRRLKISLFVIDEAHCISQWGHEFRPDYLKLRTVIKQLGTPPVLALSATATPEVQEDIIQSLDIPDMERHIHPMDKQNLTFIIEKTVSDKEKNERIVSLLNRYHVPALIYFTSRTQAEETARILSARLQNRKIAFYHGGMEQLDRISIQQQFMNDQIDIVCCTSAFGMGINKSNIRIIIHYHLPLQLEAYIQEVGRAGRDGKPSIGILLFSPRDVHMPGNMIKSELPDETAIKNVFHYLKSLPPSKTVPSSLDSEVEYQLQINEIQWRFFRYQLEKHGIIKNNHIVIDEENWKRSYIGIRQLVRKRIDYKEKKMNEVINWVYEKECLREKLYESFQDGCRPPDQQCCSNCGFSWEDWQADESLPERIEHASWKTELRDLLLQGQGQ